MILKYYCSEWWGDSFCCFFFFFIFLLSSGGFSSFCFQFFSVKFLFFSLMAGWSWPVPVCTCFLFKYYYIYYTLIWSFCFAFADNPRLSKMGYNWGLSCCVRSFMCADFTDLSMNIPFQQKVKKIGVFSSVS